MGGVCSNMIKRYQKAIELLRYEDSTGCFYWKESRIGRVNAGDLAGSVSPRGYRHIVVNGRCVKAHRLAWFKHHNELPDSIDHINGDKDDNRIVNLRACTQLGNNKNARTRKDNTSGHRGVHWLSKGVGCWVVQININKKRTYLGRFKSFEEAVACRLQAETDYFGEFSPQRGVHNNTMRRYRK